MANEEELETFKDAIYSTLKSEEYYYANLNNDNASVIWNNGWHSGLAFTTAISVSIIEYTEEKTIEDLFNQIIDCLNINKKIILKIDNVDETVKTEYEKGFKAAISSQEEMLIQTWEQLFSTDEDDEGLYEEEQ